MWEECESEDDVSWQVYMTFPKCPDNPYPKTDPRAGWFDKALSEEWGVLAKTSKYEGQFE